MGAARGTDSSWAVYVASSFSQAPPTICVCEKGMSPAESVAEQHRFFEDRRSEADTWYVDPAHSSIA